MSEADFGQQPKKEKRKKEKKDKKKKEEKDDDLGKVGPNEASPSKAGPSEAGLGKAGPSGASVATSKHKKHKKEEREIRDDEPTPLAESVDVVGRDIPDRTFSMMAQASDESLDGGPGMAYMAYVVMEDLTDKLKLLDYERDFCRPLRMKPLSRHYFVFAHNAGEQFYMFTSLCAWLLRKAGRPMEQPLESDDPNVTVATILEHCRQLDVQLDFPPSRLKRGCGEQVIYVVDRLADHATRAARFQWRRPQLPDEAADEEDEAEITFEKVEDAMSEASSAEEEEGAVLDLEDLRVLPAEARPDHILESTTSAEQWRLEMERVLPQLRVRVGADARDWRTRLDQMHQYRAAIDDSLLDTQALLSRLHAQISLTMDKITNREKYLNSQLERPLSQFRQLMEERFSTEQQYRSVSGGVVERSRQLTQLTEELEAVKQELEERGTSMTDGTPLVTIRKALNRIKQEVQGMDVRIGVVEHTLLQYRLRDKEALQQEANVQFTSSSIGLY